MVKFDIKVFEFLKKEHFRVLTAVEQGMKNHELVPTELIESIARQKRGSCFKIISDLHKHKLVVHDSRPCFVIHSPQSIFAEWDNFDDGYRLTFRGYDYLAIHTLVKRGLITGIGRQIGVGKESDVYEAYDARTEPVTVNVIKLHRLGTTAFHNVKVKRDYLHKKTQSVSNWLYMSRLSALKEYAFMQTLHQREFPVPTPIDVCRHAVLMSKVKGFPMTRVKKMKHPGLLYGKCMALIVKLAKHGLIHCDFNEFNLMVDSHYRLTLIDFPQTISIHHRNAVEYFNRDVRCIRNYFYRKFGFFSDDYPVIDEEWAQNEVHTHLDRTVEASGHFEAEQTDEFERLMNEHRIGVANGRTGADDEIFGVGRVTGFEVESKEDQSEGVRHSDDRDSESVGSEEESTDSVNSSDLERTEKEREKRAYEESKSQKKAAFAKRQRLKMESERKMAETEGLTDFESSRSGLKSRQVLSEAEIRRRVKKKNRDEVRRHRLKKTRKTGHKQKLVQQMKRDVCSGSAALWA